MPRWKGTGQRSREVSKAQGRRLPSSQTKKTLTADCVNPEDDWSKRLAVFNWEDPGGPRSEPLARQDVTLRICPLGREKRTRVSQEEVASPDDPGVRFACLMRRNFQRALLLCAPLHSTLCAACDLSCREQWEDERNRIWCGPRRVDGRISGRERPASSSAVGPCLIPKGGRKGIVQTRRAPVLEGCEVWIPDLQAFPLDQAHGTWDMDKVMDVRRECSFDHADPQGGYPTSAAQQGGRRRRRRRRPLLAKEKVRSR